MQGNIIHLIFVTSLLFMLILSICLYLSNISHFTDVTEEAARRAQNLVQQTYSVTKPGKVEVTETQ